MTFSTSISAHFHCSLERAFKTPMLCDVSKVHTGFGIMPKVTHCTADETWGRPGGTKKIFAAPSLTQSGGYASRDTVIERIENKYWKIEVSDFQAWILGFSRFTGEWETTELEPGKILITYTYTMHSNQWILFPLQWLFTKLFWRTYMRQVLENVRKLAYDKEPYLYP